MNFTSKILIASAAVVTLTLIAWQSMPYKVDLGRWNVDKNEEKEAYTLAQNLIRYGGYTWDLSKNRPHPNGSRRKPYQSLDEMSGSRDMEHRYKVMQFPENMEGKRILDLGSNLGRICLDASERGAKEVVGVDFNPDMVRVANEYKAWKEKHGKDFSNVDYYVVDLNKGLENLKTVIGEQQFDYVFALAVWGVVDHQSLWNIINHYAKDKVWFEGHNIGGKYGDQSKEYVERVLKENTHSKSVRFVGFSHDDKKRQRANFVLEMGNTETAAL